LRILLPKTTPSCNTSATQARGKWKCTSDFPNNGKE
jgi:hypothetical protein